MRRLFAMPLFLAAAVLLSITAGHVFGGDPIRNPFGEYGRWLRFLTFERLQAGVDAQGGMRSRVRYVIFVWSEERNR